MRKCRLNNMQLGYQRRDVSYEAVMIDLYLMGALSKDMVEKWLGYEIPDHLKGPNGEVPEAEDINGSDA